LNDETSVLTKSGFIFITKMLVHAFANQSNSVTGILVVDMPGGFEHYYDAPKLHLAMEKL